MSRTLLLKLAVSSQQNYKEIRQISRQKNQINHYHATCDKIDKKMTISK